MRFPLQIAAILLCSSQVWGMSTAHSPVVVLRTRDPAFIFSEGPGTVLSVQALIMPFVKPRWAVVFKTDRGEVIEVWHPSAEAPVIEGMHGTLMYSMHPEQIFGFRVSEEKPSQGDLDVRHSSGECSGSTSQTSVFP